MTERLPLLLVLLSAVALTLVGEGYAAPGTGGFYDDFNDGNADSWAVSQGEWSVTSLGSSLVASTKTFIGGRKWADVSGTYCQGAADIYDTNLNPAFDGHMSSFIKGSNYSDFRATVEAVVISSPTREREMAIIFRAQDPQNFYFLRWFNGYTDGDDHLELWKYVNGTAILLKQSRVDAIPIGTRVVFKLSARGSKIEAQVLAKGAGTPSSKPLSISDSTYASGFFGLDTYHTVGCFDSVRITL